MMHANSKYVHVPILGILYPDVSPDLKHARSNLQDCGITLHDQFNDVGALCISKCVRR